VIDANTPLLAVGNAEADRIARLLRSDDGKLLLAKIDAWYRTDLNCLKSASEPLLIGRYQGRIEALERLYKLREE
jgi:hypothetical protein